MEIVLAKPYQRFVPADISVPAEPLLRVQGYRNLEAVRDDVRAIAEGMAACATELLAVEALYRRLRIERRTDDTIRLEEGTVFHSEALRKALSGCDALIVFVLTLGPKLDAKTRALLQDSDVVEALFLETAGWIAIERATKALAGKLQAEAAEQGLSLGRRLAPGYADWPLQEQSALFGLLAAAPLQVRLLESCAMAPKNSRSGVYGLRPAA